MNHKLNWFLDFILLVGFLAAFFLELTGVAFHQWLGIGLFVLTIIHLINHWDWVKMTAVRFFGQNSKRNQLYAWMDILLLLGLVVIIETGLVISTWFNLSLSNFSGWVNVHVYCSVGTLILLVVKIGLHWRWIVTIARKIFRKSAACIPAVIPAGNPASLSRRQFLATMGVVSLGSFIAIQQVLSKKVSAGLSALAENTVGINPQSTATADAQSQATATQTPVSDSQPAAATTTVPQAAAATAPQPATQVVNNCSFSCHRGRHCAFPGQCHDYRDSNGNGLCDKGECL